MENRVALVTGCSRGIGKAIANKLESTGYHVIKYGKIDLSTSEGVSILISYITDNYNHIDIIVNNAAYTEFKALDDLDNALFNKMFALNLRAPLHLIKALKHMMAKSINPNIINIGSIAGVTGNGSNVGYSSLKAGIIAMSRTLARELCPIRVNCISPGLIDTTFVKFPDGTREGIISNTPIQRIGTPEDVADAVFGIINMKYVTGQNLLVDGGKSLT